MDIEDIKSAIQSGDFRLSLHADIEAANENLDIAQVVRAILNSQV